MASRSTPPAGHAPMPGRARSSTVDPTLPMLAETVMLVPDEPATVHVGSSNESPVPGSAPSAEGTAPAEERFVDEGEIGRGGMASVHKVFDRAILRTIAHKRLHDTLRFVPGAQVRFLEEAQITGQLDHPNIVPVHDVVTDENGTVCSFSMKMVRGATLREVITAAHSAGLPGGHIEALLQVFMKICDAVAFAHSRGVVHRDLKPDNVMVGSFGQVYLMDWGIARLLKGSRPSDLSVDASAFGLPDDAWDDDGDQSRTVVGTPAYMAPEQARGALEEIDERTDVFGLGAILYRCLTNRAPFSAKSSAAAVELARAGVVPPPATLVPSLRLPPGLVRITMKALSKEPADRHQSARALRDEIQSFLRGGGWFRTLELKPGTVIVREGDKPDAAYIINRGTCEAYKVIDGKRQSLRKMGPGEAFGETSIFTDQPRTASVVAVDQVELTEITREALEQECGEQSWLRSFVSALAERFLDVDRELTELRAKISRETG
jgi:serine/threonine protein kinase